MPNVYTAQLDRGLPRIFLNGAPLVPLCSLTDGEALLPYLNEGLQQFTAQASKSGLPRWHLINGDGKRVADVPTVSEANTLRAHLNRTTQ